MSAEATDELTSLDLTGSEQAHFEQELTEGGQSCPTQADNEQPHPEQAYLSRENKAYLHGAFFQKRKRGAWRQVEAPQLVGAVADTHAHLQLLDDPVLSLVRCGALGVNFVVTITDIVEDGAVTFENLAAWQGEAARILSELSLSAGLPASAGLSASDQPQQPPAMPSAPDSPYLSPLSSLPEPPHLRIVCGCHPHNAKDFTPAAEAALRQRLNDERVCAVGEIGLDYHYDFSPRETQREVFARQLAIAREYKLPVVLHIREAHDDAFEILTREGLPPAGTLLHCYNLDAAELVRWVDAGCYVAFGGALTFHASEDVREAAKTVPLDRLLTETDAPYMSPEPLRGIKCGPEYVIFTAALLCELFKAQTAESQRAFLAKLNENAHALLDQHRFGRLDI